ncbi:MAG: hypothetical protein N3A72_02025 [bacterium]|nr:hypothetical protein [bacterium]
MFCPKCQAEYEVGITECSDCQIPLMERLPEEKDKPVPEAELVSVIQIMDESEAVFYCELLKQSGITATFRSFIIPGYDGITESTPYKGEVLVLEEDADQAEQIIADYLKTLDNFELEEEPEEEP